MRITRSASLRKKIVLPVLFVLIIQMLLYVFLFSYGGIVTRIDQNATDIFYRQADSLGMRLENEMLHRWANLSRSEEDVLKKVKAVLLENGKTAADIAQDSALNEKLLLATADTVVDLLHRNSVTGAFLVLDGAGVGTPGYDGSKAALYLRDLDPETAAPDNSDILMERGLPSIAEELQFPLDIYWSSVIYQEDENAFFARPIEEAKKDGASGRENYGCWTAPVRLSPEDIPVLTYAVPLIAEDQTVIGALGIEVTVEYLTSVLRVNNYPFDDVTVSLVVGEAGRPEQLSVARVGTLLDQYYDSDSGFRVERWNKEPQIAVLNAPAGAHGQLYAAMRPLKLYNSDTSFGQEVWQVVAIQEEAKLFQLSSQLRTLVWVLSALTFLIGTGVILAAVLSVTKPIQTLMQSVESSGAEPSVRLPKLGITEIDKLSGSIEVLSKSVAESASRFAQIIQKSDVMLGVFEYQNTGGKVFCSSRLFEILDWEQTGETDLYLDREVFLQKLSELTPYSETEDKIVYRILTRQGTERFVSVTSMEAEESRFGVVSDVTQQTEEKNRLAYERDYDSLTKLLNRRAFRRRLEELFASPAQLKTAAMIMWDLDDLKYVNDTYGHECGDRYITNFSSILSALSSAGLCAERCEACRRSGDEFFLFLYGYDTKEEVMEILGRLSVEMERSAFSLPDGRAYKTRATGGISWYPQDTGDLGELLRYADFAMYCVKKSTKGVIGEFSAEQWEKNALLVNGREAFNELLETPVVHFAFQPVFDSQTGKVAGYEALMRSDIPQFNNPRDILRMAKNRSKLFMIEKLTLFGALDAFAALASQNKVVPDSLIFINSLPNQTLTEDEVERMEREYSELLSRLVLEIVEDEAVEPEFFAFKRSQLSRWGAQLAIDDYGMGHSNLALLLEVVPDILKVDISIIRSIDTLPDKQSFLSGLISYCHSHGIKVLAEGVETSGELKTCVRLGVDFLQGFYLARPGELLEQMPDALFRETLEAQAQRAASDS